MQVQIITITIIVMLCGTVIAKPVDSLDSARKLEQDNEAVEPYNLAQSLMNECRSMSCIRQLMKVIAAFAEGGKDRIVAKRNNFRSGFAQYNLARLQQQRNQQSRNGQSLQNFHNLFGR
eukprot:Seg114.4 transcript_id=Seg114.4/GoldUCD/mRNA.D3Y31 product="hypothetical protein" protein_id=Seg114.4/GoldUCD/D3Y31